MVNHAKPVSLRMAHGEQFNERKFWIFGAFLAVVVFATFANCLRNSFVWDDEQFIVKNIFLTSPKYLLKLFTENAVKGAGLTSNLYRPFQMLTHFVDVRIWGYRPFGHHLTNVLLHVAMMLAVFRLATGIFSLRSAFGVAAVFALHPLQSEAVAYVSGRGDTLSIIFLCLSLLYFERKLWFSLFFALLAVLSKENMVLLPVFILLYESIRSRPPFTGPAAVGTLPSSPVTGVRAAGGRGLPSGVTREWRHHAPFWALSALYVVLRITVLNFQNTLNFYNQSNALTENFHYRFYTYLTTVTKGILLWVWPFDLHHERSWPVYAIFSAPRVWLSLLFVVTIFAAAFLARKKSRLFCVGVLWFFLATLPTSNLFVLINAIFYDHWFILPGLGLAVIFGVLRARVLSMGGAMRRVSALVLAGLLVTLSVTTARYNNVWRSPVTLYTHILSREPKSAKICNNLGMAYADEGKIDESIEWYKKAIGLSDEYPQTHHNLATAYLAKGEETEAIEELKRAVAIDPNFYNSWLDLGLVHLKRGEREDAREAFERTLQVYPYALQAYLGLAQIYFSEGDKNAAASVLKKGLVILPENAMLKAALEKVT